MARASGNQYSSEKRLLLSQLWMARLALRMGAVWYAQELLKMFHTRYAEAPASTRRRWKCGR